MSVAVVAGGWSRRMGRDKALLEVHGRPLMARVLERVAGIGDEVFVVAAERPEYTRFGVRIVPDRVPGAAALGGIYTAVAEASHPHCLVVACDMPFLNPELLRYMADLPRDYDVLVPALAEGRSDQGSGETLETLHAIYGKTCLPAMERRLASDELKVADLFSDVHTRRVPEDVVRSFDPDLLSFFNANTPADLAWARRRVESDEAGSARRAHQSREAGG